MSALPLPDLNSSRIPVEIISPNSVTTAAGGSPLSDNVRFDVADETELIPPTKYEDGAGQTRRLLSSYKENTDWLRECGATSMFTLWRLRVERGLRFISMIPLALFLTYSNICGTNFSYLIVILYTILSALMLPNPPTFNMIVFMGLPAGLLGAAAACLILFSVMLIRPFWAFEAQAADVAAYKSLVGWLSVGLYAALMVPFVVWKTSSLAALMMIPLYTYTYTMQQLLNNLFVTVKNGIHVHFPIETVERLTGADLDIFTSYLAAIGQKFLQTDPSFIAAALKRFRQHMLVTMSKQYAQKFNCYLFTALFDRSDLNAPILRDGECRILVPDEIKHIDTSLAPLIGTPVLIKANMADGVQVHMNLHTNFISFMWIGKRHYSFMVGILIASALAAGLIFFSQYIPVPRFVRSIFRMSVFSNFQACKLHAIQLSSDEDSNKDDQLQRFLDAGSVPIIKGIRQKTRYIFFMRVKRTMDLRDLYRIKHSSTLPYFDEMFLRIDACKRPLILSLFEHGLFSPVGANTFFEASPILEALKHNATHHAAIVETLPSIGQTAGWQHELRDLDPEVNEWVWACVQDSLRLQQMTETAMGLKNSLSADHSQMELLNDTRIQLDHLNNRLKLRQAQFLSHNCGDIPIKTRILAGLLVKYAHLDSFGTSNNNNDVSEKFSSWRSVLEEFYFIYIESPIRASQAAYDWITGQIEKSSVRFRTSMYGFVAPLGLMFIGLLKPWGKFLEWFIKTIFFIHKYPKCPAPSRINMSSVSSVGVGKYSSWSSYALSVKSNRRMKRRLSEFLDFCVCFRFVLGTTALVGLVLLVPEFSQRLWTGSVSEKDVNTVLEGNAKIDIGLLRIGKASSWTLLGFLTCLNSTLEGTLKRSCLRLIGVITGTFFAWLCLLAFPTNQLMHGVWLCVTEFIVVVLAAHPTMPQLGFHPSWGYAAQLFTYQQTIIVVESYLNPTRYPRDEIVVQRLIGQCIGIGAAVLTALLVFPTRVTPACRHKLGDCIFSLRNMTESLINMSISSVNISQPDTTWNQYFKKVNRILNHDLQQEEAIRNDNKVFEEVRYLNTPEVISELYICISRMTCIRRELYDLLTDNMNNNNNDNSIQHMLDNKPPALTESESVKRSLQCPPVLRSVCESKTIATLPHGLMWDECERDRPFTMVHVEASHRATPPSQRMSSSISSEDDISNADQKEMDGESVRRAHQTIADANYFGATLPAGFERRSSSHEDRGSLLSEDTEMERRLASPAASRGGTFLLNRHHRKLSPSNFQSGYSPVSQRANQVDFSSIMVPEPSPTSRPPTSLPTEYLQFSELYAADDDLDQTRRSNGNGSVNGSDDAGAGANVYWVRYEDVRKERDAFAEELESLRRTYRNHCEQHIHCEEERELLHKLKAEIEAAEQKALEELAEQERLAALANLPPGPPEPAATLEGWQVPCIFQSVQSGVMDLWDCLSRVYTLIEFGVHRGGRTRTVWKCSSYKYSLVEWEAELSRAFVWLDKTLNEMRFQMAVCSVVHNYAGELEGLPRHRLDTYSCGPSKMYLLDRLLEFLRAEIQLLKTVQVKVVNGGIWKA